MQQMANMFLTILLLIKEICLLKCGTSKDLLSVFLFVCLFVCVCVCVK